MAKGIYVTPTQFVSFAESKRDLTREIASRDRAMGVFTGYLSSLPNPDPILKSLGRDISVYRDLRAEPLVGSSIRRRKSAVKALERGLTANGASDAVMAFLTDVMSQWDIDRIIGELLDGPLFGYQPAELTWEKDGGHLVVSNIVGKPPEWFSFDDGNQLRFRSRHAGLAGELLPPRKFVVAAQDASYDNPYGFPDLSMCFWPVTFKKGGWKFWMRFTEKYGSPWVIGKHPRGTAQSEIDLILDALETMVEDSVAAIPDDSSVEILEAAGKGDSSGIYKDLIQMARSEISIALLGQNQTTEANSNRASAQAGLEVTADIRDGDASLVVSTVNQVLRWLVELNFGDVPCPVWGMWEQESVDEIQSKRDYNLAQAGAIFTPQYFQREYGLQPGDLRESAVTTPLTDVAFAEAAADADLNAQDQLDHALDSLMKTGKLDKVLTPVLAPLFAAVRQGVSPSELMGQLAELYPQMGADDLQERLARVLFVAKVWGRLHANAQ
ncbi:MULTISPECIES: DUF935 domain-containing protein [unclassified Serratia (in: enterobacteria)]|uniref:DUF935 domain-containing protein n=1 Tax=unclassified Serratia (in: enterobacteria) TaxID=2647522 RepID=UPI0005074582|nr:MULTISPECIES: DUF935 family protein [unclassified Serratia (in: enterobacteria)]KFK91769.1 hypothetical protein JV45_24425 [Serratia sp. Ag2]KFK98569.1 hypothetical protein IV04_11975 [Serratia sp. Ag1]